MQVDRQNAFLYLWGFCLAKQTDNIGTKTCGRSLNFLKFIRSAMPDTLPPKKVGHTSDKAGGFSPQRLKIKILGNEF